MLISNGTRAFAAEHRDEDVRDLALHAKPGPDVDLTAALEQISGWRTARVKLPAWAACGDVVYPPHLSMEQCSSEATARYKAGVARRVVVDGARTGCTTTLVDLTGGFGVDFSYMAQVFDHAVYVERQERLCELAAHNMPALGLAHASIVNGDAAEYLSTIGRDGATLIFLDPARRDSHGARTYAIADCTPDVLGLLDRLLAAAPHVMVKLSPMLDWHKTVADFAGHVHEVHIVSTGNECKELLLVVGRDVYDAPRVFCANDGQMLEFDAGDDGSDGVDGAGTAAVPAGGDVAGHGAHIADPGDPDTWRYLYEPNASVMKAGCFALLAHRFGVAPIARDSHLFVSAKPAAEFPGRVFEVDAVATMNKKDLKRLTDGLTHANIATRNFPLPVAALRKKLKLKDGGDAYLFATTDAAGRHIVIRSRKLPRMA
ncbi:class I SAM-dependent methyltransferase [Bifidobacterium platyrrhinorum]|uniref:SAM-dependent methyltransferase n=1 Tax=Bifidobacterium platyrrhinorum TaxID=2661628 RepID=A0A6L9SWH9_9BIFI|nr:SAM-dependent methyltransferase [Bifidobacterium platyrrhinorum]NEG56173.1 SAM-dependent methyltransferase [Bifidobacterium platyrrhinorum]